jgi:hypothetical protein
MLNKSKNLAKVMTSVSVNKSTSGSKSNKKAPTEWRERISPEMYELLR